MSKCVFLSFVRPMQSRRRCWPSRWPRYQVPTSTRESTDPNQSQGWLVLLDVAVGYTWSNILALQLASGFCFDCGVSRALVTLNVELIARAVSILRDFRMLCCFVKRRWKFQFVKTSVPKISGNCLVEMIYCWVEYWYEFRAIRRQSVENEKHRIILL